MTANRIVLGTSKLGLENGREGAFALLDAYAELGGTAIDTASVYSDWVTGETGRSETVLREWLKARGNRDALQITTKGAHPPLGDMSKGRCDPASIRHDVDLSLKRLCTDRIDLYYLHRDEPGRPVAEIMGTLRALQREGKILAFGGSNWTVARLAKALALPAPTFTASQVLGNVLCRLMTPPTDTTIVTLDAPAFHQAVEAGLRLDLFTSQCQGLLDKRRRGAAAPADYANPACATAAGKIEAIAAREEITANDLILAFLLALGPNVRPIIGPRTPEQLRASYSAGTISLDPAIVGEVAGAAGMAGFLVA